MDQGHEMYVYGLFRPLSYESGRSPPSAEPKSVHGRVLWPQGALRPEREIGYVSFIQNILCSVP